MRTTKRAAHCLRLTGMLVLVGAALSGLLWLLGLGAQAWFGFTIAGCFLAVVDGRFGRSGGAGRFGGSGRSGRSGGSGRDRRE